MKIALVGPGIIEIPPKGGGAVESLIWDYATELGELGHEGSIINTPDRDQIIRELTAEPFDYIHVHYDVFYDMMDLIHEKCPNAKLAISSHYPYIDQPDRHPHDGYYRIYKWLIQNDKYYNFEENPGKPDWTLYLGKIEPRKRQHVYQCIYGIEFVGHYTNTTSFNPNLKDYLGEWSHQHKLQHVTDYGNMLLLSDGENGTPLVIKEALIAGLGVVVSKYAAHDLDKSLPFVTVIPDDKWNDIEYVSEELKRNREISVTMRKDIRQYGGDNFSWQVLVKKYVENIEGMQ